MNCFVKETYNVIWHFYHNSHGICFCKMTDENITEYQVLLPDGQEDFDVCIDDSDCIHLLCQNIDGDIMYINHFNGQWRKTVLLKSKTQSAYKKDFIIKASPDRLDAFYCIEYNNRRMLTHHIIDSYNTSPMVIDCINGDFCISSAPNGSLCAFYYSETSKSWGTKTYYQKEWGDFCATEGIKNCKNPFLYIDNHNKTHILYEDSGYITQFYEGKNITIGMGQNPVMAYQSCDMIIWEGIADNKIYIKRTDEENPTVFMPGGFAKPVKMRLRYTNREPNINADCCPGNIVNGAVRTYGINNFFTTVPKNTGQELEETKIKNDTYLEIQKLKIQLGQINRILEKLQAQLNTEDIEKINRRLEEIEQAVNKNTRPKFFNLL